MQEVSGELLDQRSNVMPEHITPKNYNKAMPCQELLCLLVLVYLEVPFTKVPTESAGKLQNTTMPRKTKEGYKLT